MRNLHNEDTDELFRAFLSLGSVEECYDFFEDVCTINEIKDMTQRLKVAKMLDAGKNYQDISSVTGASAATISRVNKCLLYGNGGYKRVIDTLENDPEKGDAK